MNTLKEAIWEALETTGGTVTDLRVHEEGGTVSVQCVIQYEEN